MDRTITVDGMDIVIESLDSDGLTQSKHQNRTRLLTYYQKLLEVKGIDPNADQMKALKHLVGNMTEQRAKEKADDFERAQYNRLLAYATALTKLQLEKEDPEEAARIEKEEIEKLDKMASALVEVLDASADEEQTQQETVDINGNKFVYEKGSLNIRDYVQKLFDIGENTKGNTWSIYLDDEGELVIY